LEGTVTLKLPVLSTMIESANCLAYLAKARAFKPKGKPTPNPAPRMSKNTTVIEMHKHFFR
jgi:hypothetical protein